MKLLKIFMLCVTILSVTQVNFIKTKGHGSHHGGRHGGHKGRHKRGRHRRHRNRRRNRHRRRHHRRHRHRRRNHWRHGRYAHHRGWWRNFNRNQLWNYWRYPRYWSNYNWGTYYPAIDYLNVPAVSTIKYSADPDYKCFTGCNNSCYDWCITKPDGSPMLCKNWCTNTCDIKCSSLQELLGE